MGQVDHGCKDCGDRHSGCHSKCARYVAGMIVASGNKAALEKARADDVLFSWYVWRSPRNRRRFGQW